MRPPIISPPATEIKPQKRQLLSYQQLPRKLTAAFLVRVISAVVLAVALPRLRDAVAVPALELRGSTCPPTVARFGRAVRRLERSSESVIFLYFTNYPNYQILRTIAWVVDSYTHFRGSITLFNAF